MNSYIYKIEISIVKIKRTHKYTYENTHAQIYNYVNIK